MSGITAIFDRDGRPIDRDLFGRMHNLIAHRGLDGSNAWIDGAVALGHQMFHTTPESVRETQPVATSDGRLRLILDGRVDNRDELSAALRAHGTQIRDDTDAELVIRAYEVWSLDAPRRIIGDFALVIWNARTRQLFCARDTSGIRPFYYCCDARRFYCGSEIAQLLEDRELSREPDEQMVGEYLTGTFVTRDRTLFRKILRLEAGHYLTVDADRVRIGRFFDLDPGRKIRYARADDYVENFREIFDQAVSCRMRALGGVAVHLSGGVDSTSVAGTANALLRENRTSAAPVETFSLLMPYKDCDERAWIQQAVEMFGLPANYSDPFVIDPRQCAESVARHKDFADYPNGIMWANLWSGARDRGFRVMLSGTGSDEWMSGSMYEYADMLLRLRWAELWRRTRADSQKWFKWTEGRRNAFTFFLRFAVWPLLPARLQILMKRASDRDFFPSFVNLDFARRIGLAERMRRKPRYPAWLSFGRRAVYDNFVNGWVAHGLETNDRTTALFGVEERHPFHDRRLIEFLFAVPEKVRCCDRRRKAVLRDAMRGRIPEAIRERRDKADFSIVFVKVLEQLTAHGWPDSMALEQAGWVNSGAFRQLFVETLKDYEEMNLWPIWTTFSLELWYRLVVLREEASGQDPHRLPEVQKDNNQPQAPWKD